MSDCQFVPTFIVGRRSVVLPVSLDDRLRVLGDLPGQLEEKGKQNAEVLVEVEEESPDQVEDEAVEKVGEAVGVEKVLRDRGTVPLFDSRRPPGSLVPGHVV